MRLFRFASLLVPAVLALAGGCVPLTFLAADKTVGAGGTTDEGEGGFGGNYDVMIASGSNATGGGTGGGYGTGGMAGKPSYGYLCGGSHPDCSPDPGSSDCAPGGNPNMGNGADAGSKLTCHLVAEGDQAVAQCGLSGEAAAGFPCKTATDCMAGHGCGATGITGVCAQYCCGDPELCPKDTYCTPAAMADSAVQVPLCMPASKCDLLNDAAWCKNGQVCAIVRNDGTTSCVDPGTGVEGEACPCAAGYTCSNATGTCLKLCHVDGNECGTGTCQGGTLPYPIGIGFCVPQSAQ